MYSGKRRRLQTDPRNSMLPGRTKLGRGPARETEKEDRGKFLEHSILETIMSVQGGRMVRNIKCQRENNKISVPWTW